MSKIDLFFTPEQIARFWSKVDRSDPSRCWHWQGWKNHSGHGRFDLGPRQKVLAHQLALIFSGYPRPDAPNDNVLHGDGCAPCCCNPAHLRWGTHKQNAEDRERLQRRKPARGVNHGNAKLNDDAVRYIRSSPLSQRALARELGVSQPIIGQVRRRVIWSHVT